MSSVCFQKRELYFFVNFYWPSTSSISLLVSLCFYETSLARCIALGVHMWRSHVARLQTYLIPHKFSLLGTSFSSIFIYSYFLLLLPSLILNTVFRRYPEIKLSNSSFTSFVCSTREQFFSHQTIISNCFL